MRRVLGLLHSHSTAAALLLTIALVGCAVALLPAVHVQDLKLEKRELEGVQPLVKVKGR